MFTHDPSQKNENFEAGIKACKNAAMNGRQMVQSIIQRACETGELTDNDALTLAIAHQLNFWNSRNTVALAGGAPVQSAVNVTPTGSRQY